MGTRLELQEKLQNLIGVRPDGKQNVYFQPPESMRLVYPCIVYKRDSGDSKYANDMTYVFTNQYAITVITEDPDCKLYEKLIKEFPMIRHTAFLISDNLNHDNFVLYY